jgi:hypothetical protein
MVITFAFLAENLSRIGYLPWSIFNAHNSSHGFKIRCTPTLLRAHSGEGLTAAPRYALVVAYQPSSLRPLQHGAIALERLPQTITVGDAARCDLPVDSDLWPLLALSCFQHDGHAVPILDTARLFGAYHG